MRLAGLALIAALVSLAGCTSHVGPTGPVIGGPCRDDFDCASGSFCLTGFSGGTCTTNCSEAGHCRGESACVEVGAGVCLLTCETDEDCGREGYVCDEQVRRGETDSAFVCIGS